MSDNKQKLIRVYIEALKTTFDEHIETDIDLINSILCLYFNEHQDYDFHLIERTREKVRVGTRGPLARLIPPRIKVTKTVAVN